MESGPSMKVLGIATGVFAAGLFALIIFVAAAFSPAQTEDPFSQVTCGSSTLACAAFSTNPAVGFVGPFSPEQLQARMARIAAWNGMSNVDPFFGTQSDGSWHNDCQKFVAILGGRSSSGYASANVAWTTFVRQGTAHPQSSPDGMAPPIGAWLYYKTKHRYGHVVVYMGNGMVAGTDTWGDGTAQIGPASDLTGGRWNLEYLGWAAPWGKKVETALPATVPVSSTSASTISVATLNVLGASHTSSGGDSKKAGYQSRTRKLVSFLASKGTDVVGLQEFQSPQATLFDKLAGGTYSRYPTKKGVSPENSVIWRKDRFEFVSGEVGTIPYFNGARKKIPWVKLRHRASGKIVIVSSTHNPASGCAVCGGNNDRWRRAAVKEQVQTITALRGTPVLFVGDFNERRSAFCAFTAGGLMTSPAGGKHVGSTCTSPKGLGIDQIFGAGVVWSEYDSDESARAFTDHPYVSARTTIL